MSQERGRVLSLKEEDGRKREDEQKHKQVETEDSVTIIKTIMDTVEAQRVKLNERLQSDYDVPLHCFTAKKISDTLKQWIYNDINHQQHLKATMQLFCTFNLSSKGSDIAGFRKRVREHLSHNQLPFLTEDMLKIMLDGLEFLDQPDTDMNAAETARRMYMIPINRLDRFIKCGIDGPKFIELVRSSEPFIEGETGWESEEAYQLQSVMLRHASVTNDQFMKQMDLALGFDILSRPTGVLRWTHSWSESRYPYTFHEPVTSRPATNDATAASATRQLPLHLDVPLMHKNLTFFTIETYMFL